MTLTAAPGERETDRLRIVPPHLDPRNPTGEPFRLGRFHPARLTVIGFRYAAAVYGKSLFTPRHPKASRILMIARARSGSTLLGRLLGQLPDTRFGGEELGHFIPFPAHFADTLGQSFPEAHWGFKLLSYQMAEVYRTNDGVGFLRRFTNRGYRLLHLERKTLPQLASLLTAQTSNQFHIKKGEGTAAKPRPPIDPDRFLRGLRFQSDLLDFERQVLAHFPHEKVQYEDDLEDPAGHQPLIDRLAAAFNLPTAPVTASLEKLSTQSFYENVPNAAELDEVARRAGFADIMDGRR